MPLCSAYSKYLRHRRHRKSHLKLYETSPSSPFIILLVILAKAKSFVNKISLLTLQKKQDTSRAKAAWEFSHTDFKYYFICLFFRQVPYKLRLHLSTKHPQHSNFCFCSYPTAFALLRFEQRKHILFLYYLYILRCCVLYRLHGTQPIIRRHQLSHS